ncbi:MAG: Crp/Fnr family transcriptional regulator [Cellvibrionaceae bacterium]|nr:Crp/Fnr family transcriptional regulator [Cellvibrionaceae bacterium]
MLPQYLKNYPTVTVAAGTTVLQQGQSCQHCLIVSQGRVKVFARARDGRELLLYRIEPEQLCVLTTACLLGGEPFPAEAISETEVTAHALPINDFKQLLLSEPEFQQRVLKGFSQRLSALMAQMESLTLHSLDQRLHHYLCQQAARGNRFDCTHQDIATEIGSSREVVSRHLKTLEQQGLLQLGRGHIILLKPEAFVLG